jgi:hypothetical protein
MATHARAWDDRISQTPTGTADEEDDEAQRLLGTAALLGCLPYASDNTLASVASSPARRPRVTALFTPDSPLLASRAATASPSAAVRVSQRTARRRALVQSSDRLRDVRLRADARTAAGLLSTDPPPSLQALRFGVDPQAVADTVRRELQLEGKLASAFKTDAVNFEFCLFFQLRPLPRASHHELEDC